MNNSINLISKIFILPLALAFLVLNAGCSMTPRAKPANVIDRSGGSSEPAPPGYYRVKRGDTLARIALDHGQSPRDVAQWNNMSNPNQIEVGDLILVKPPANSKLVTKPAPKTTPNIDTPKTEAPKVDVSKSEGHR
jgi:lipoprotein NlpD